MSMDRDDKVSPDFIGYAAASGQRTAYSLQRPSYFFTAPI